MVMSEPSVAEQARIYRLIQETPDWRDYLQAIVEWETEHPPSDLHPGWQWHAVHVPTGVINQLIGRKLVDVVSESRQYRYYRLADLEATRSALELSELRDESSEPVDVESMFKLVVGHERVKTLVRYTIKAEEPVHCLLIGPPGTAKTLILSDIGRLTGAEFYVGSTTTKAGLVGLLLSAKPRYLVIDELDKMAPVDMTPLLNLMEGGAVTLLQHKTQQRVHLRTKVFAGANDLKPISTLILSRFLKAEIPPYSPREFIQVATAVLTQHEGQGPQLAQHIATEVVRYTTDIRDAVRVARLARGHPLRVSEVIGCMWPDKRPRPLQPVR